MAAPIVVSPEAAYASKVNIQFPGTQTEATAAESAAESRIDDALSGTGITVTVAAGAITVET